MSAKVHTTNYYNTFIEVAEDTKATFGRKPSSKGDKKTIAELQFELIAHNPYKLTSDDVLFLVIAHRKKLNETAHQQAREQLFSKGQPCLRTSPLAKLFGFGIHCNGEGKVAIYGVETPEYRKFVACMEIKKVKAMKSSR